MIKESKDNKYKYTCAVSKYAWMWIFRNHSRKTRQFGCVFVDTGLYINWNQNHACMASIV